MSVWAPRLIKSTCSSCLMLAVVVPGKPRGLCLWLSSTSFSSWPSTPWQHPSHPLITRSRNCSTLCQAMHLWGSNCPLLEIATGRLSASTIIYISVHEFSIFRGQHLLYTDSACQLACFSVESQCPARAWFSSYDYDWCFCPISTISHIIQNLFSALASVIIVFLR